jgi:hypothetical protein
VGILQETPKKIKKPLVESIFHGGGTEIARDGALFLFEDFSGL